jgi:hypothetical protein
MQSVEKESLNKQKQNQLLDPVLGQVSTVAYFLNILILSS